MGTCIITGIGAGIGKATAILLAQRGYYDKYALIGRNKKDIDATLAEMQKYVSSNDIRTYFVDLSNPE